MECEGSCSVHNKCKGEVKKVNVKSQNMYDWGSFYYCNTAIETDKKNGFIVSVLNN